MILNTLTTAFAKLMPRSLFGGKTARNAVSVAKTGNRTQLSLAKASAGGVRRVPARELDSSGEVAESPARVRAVSADFYKSRMLERSRRLKRAFFVVVILPTCAAAIYYGAFASDRYVSQTQLVVNGDDSHSGGDSLLSLTGPGTINVPGTVMLYNYIRSAEMVEKLDKAIDLRSRFSTTAADFLSRMSPHASQEGFLDYYQRRVEVAGEPGNPIVTVTAEAFTPGDAQAILQSIVAISETSLNALLSKRQDDIIAFAKSEVASARDRLLDVQKRITEYRTEHTEIDPVQAASEVGSIAAGLTRTLAEQRANLEAMLKYLKPNNPQVQTIRAQIQGLESQLQQTRTNLAGTGGSTYAAIVSGFETLQSEEKLAQDEYATAMEFLTMARGDAQRQHAYVVDFVTPNLPDEATEPQRFRMILAVFLVSTVLFGIGVLIMTAIREQASV